MQFLTAEEVERLAAEISAPPLKPAGHGASPHWRTDLPEYGTLVRLAAYTGLRAGEITALRVGRIDFLRSQLEVVESVSEVNGVLVFGPTKNYGARVVPLPPFLRDELAVHLRGRRDPDDLVFTGPEGGPFRHNNFYTRHYKPAVRRAGLPETLRFHALRHSYAGFLIAQGAHPRAIMERSSIEVTLGTYGHLLPGIDEHLTTGLDALGREARDAARHAMSSTGTRVPREFRLACYAEEVARQR